MPPEMGSGRVIVVVELSALVDRNNKASNMAQERRVLYLILSVGIGRRGEKEEGKAKS